MEHDQLFKELLTVYFREFIELFFPNVAAFLDPEFSVVPLQQEILGDVAQKERHVVDLLMKGKFKGQDAYFLIHVENQATAQSDFPRRMYGYFSRLHLKYRLPVYPIVIFSYDTPKRGTDTVRGNISQQDGVALRVRSHSTQSVAVAQVFEKRQPGGDGTDGEDEDCAK